MPGLTQDRFLAELREGKTQAAILRQFGEKAATVQGWKQASGRFRNQYNEAMQARVAASPNLIEVRYPTWQQEFLEVYEEMGLAYQEDPDSEPVPSIPRAVAKLKEERNIDISVGAVMARLSEGHSRYDAVFADKHAEVEAAIYGPLEERYHENLLQSRDLRLQREALERNRLTRMRHRAPPERLEINKKEETRIIEEHRQTYRLEFEARAQQMFGGGDATEPGETTVIEGHATVLGGEPEAEGEEEAGEEDEQEVVAATG